MTEQQGRAEQEMTINSRTAPGQAPRDDSGQEEMTVFHPDRDAGLVTPEGGEVKVTYVTRSPRRTSARSAMTVGIVLMGILGAVFWTSYSLVSFAFCSGLPRTCPDSWIPYAAIASAGFAVTVLIGAFVAWVFYKLYGILRVD